MSTQVIDTNYIKLGQMIQIFIKNDDKNDIEFSKFKSIVETYDMKYKLSIDNELCQKKPKYLGNSVLHFVALFPEFNQPYFDLLINHGADFTDINNNGYSPLLLAFNEDSDSDPDLDFGLDLELDNPKLIDFLLSAQLKKNNPTNLKCKHGISHFHIVCSTDRAEIVEFFLKSGVPINERVHNDSPKYAGYTPLHFAAHFEQPRTIDTLLRYGASFKSKDAKGITPLSLILKPIWREILFHKPHHHPPCPIEDKWWISFNIPDALKLSYLQATYVYNKYQVFDDLFLEKDININSPTRLDLPMYPGYTPLHFACRFSNFENIISLIENGADILAKNGNGETAFDMHDWINEDLIKVLSTEKCHQLSELKLSDGTLLLDVLNALKDLNKFELLIKHKIKTVNTFIPFNSPIWSGDSLFHIILRFDENADLVSHLLSYNADFTMLNAKKEIPLYIAFHGWKVSTVQILLDAYEKMPQNSIDLSYIYIICAAQRYKLVKLFLCNGADPNLCTPQDFYWTCKTHVLKMKAGSTLLHLAITMLDYNLIEILLSFGVNINMTDADGLTPFEVALNFRKTGEYNFNFETLLILLHRYNMTKKTDSSVLFEILHVVLTDNNDSTNAQRLFKKFDKEKRFKELGLTRLQFTCAFGHLPIVKKELDSGADVNKCVDLNSAFWPGDTALHILLRQNFKLPNDIEKLLIEYGADPTVKHESNLIPIISSKFEKLNEECNEGDKEGLPIFFLCCMTNNISVAKLYLKSGINVNAPVDFMSEYNAGYTPLHFAVKYNQTEMVKLLLSHGADPQIEDANGQTPFYLIMSRDNFDIYLEILGLMRDSVIKSYSSEQFEKTIFKTDDLRNFLICISNKLPSWVEFKINLFLNKNTLMDLAKFSISDHGRNLSDAAMKLSTLTFRRFIHSIPNVKDTDAEGKTVLHFISNKDFKWYDCLKNINELLQSGLELDHKDDRGKTALHLATHQKSKQIVDILLSLGADIYIKDDNKKSPCDYAFDENMSFDIKILYVVHIKELKLAGMYHKPLKFDDSNLADYVSEIKIPRSKQEFDDKLKNEISSTFSADYFFNEEFSVDYRRMTVLQRQKIYNICSNWNDLRRNFEVIHSFINLQFRKALARIRLFEPAASALEALTVSSLPILCSEMILEYLNNDDLMNLVRAGNGTLVFAPLETNFQNGDDKLKDC